MKKTDEYAGNGTAAQMWWSKSNAMNQRVCPWRWFEWRFENIISGKREQKRTNSKMKKRIGKCIVKIEFKFKPPIRSTGSRTKPNRTEPATKKNNSSTMSNTIKTKWNCKLNISIQWIQMINQCSAQWIWFEMTAHFEICREKKKRKSKNINKNKNKIQIESSSSSLSKHIQWVLLLIFPYY